MAIEDLENLIKARERQMGGKMLDVEDTPAPENQDTEVLQIMKLLFAYVKQTVGDMNREIITIQQQQQKILEIIEKKDKE